MTKVRAKQDGVVLIEALIGILIFSIGILAMIGMQGVAMKNNTDARYRSEASHLAAEVVSRMWVDRGNLALYDTDGSAFTARDNWRNRVAALLPGINVASNINAPTIQVDTTNNQVVVTVFWLQPGETQVRKLELINRINGAT